MFGCVFGHSFRPRYSEKFPEGLTFKGKNPTEIATQMQAAKIKVYEGDVCTGCGMTANVPFRPVGGLKWPWPLGSKAEN
jgi:hypothetical protein